MTKLQIFNSCLMTLGQEPLSSDKDKSRNGEFCRDTFSLSSQIILSTYSWSCAKRRALLEVIKENSPLYYNRTGHKYQYALPLDFLSMLKIDDGSYYIIEGNYLYSDNDKIKIIYTADLSQPPVEGQDINIPPTLGNAIALYMAFKGAETMVKDQKKNALWPQYQYALIEAQGVDARNTFPDEKGEGWIV